MAKTVYPNTKPLVFKRGSIYRILGGSCCKFKMDAYEDYVIVTVHGKPQVVERDQLVMVGKADVEAYLARK